MNWYRCVSVMATLVLALGTAAQADVITHGGTTINMDFVTVGNPGNVGEQSRLDVYGDTHYYGGVDYVYAIGKYEVTADQWAAVRAADSNVGKAGYWNGSQPTGNTTWFGAARFCNWLTTGSAATGVYSFSGPIAAPTGVTIDRTYRNAGGVAYFIPTEDEWYKAAYYDPDKPGGAGYWDYPTRSDTAPVPVASGTSAGTAVYNQPFEPGPADISEAGGLSAYGTVGQGGNVWEWNETAIGSSRGLRGGGRGPSHYLLASTRYGVDPSSESFYVGFRVASVPEPGSITLMLCGGLAGLLWRRRRR